MPTGNLPSKAKALWERVYEQAKADGDSEEKAAKKAWGAVKNAGWHKKDDKWVKSADLVEFSLRIERASFDKPTQERRWRAVTSDIDEDQHTDNMTLELYQDFISRIESGESVPENFRSDYWSGGMPYLSISHYDDLDGKGVPGIVDATYIDGKALKAKGRFNNTPLGIKCFDALCDDLYNKNSETDNKIRISIGFLDWQHKHKSNGYIFTRESIDDICPECLKELITGEGKGKAYMKGHLIHYALTRVPVNERTLMEVDKSMAITRKEDAESIVGELADELDEMQKAKRKSEALVTFSEAEEEAEATPQEETPEPVVEEAKAEKEDKEKEMDDEEEEEYKKDKSEVLLARILERLDSIAPQKAPEVESHPLDEAILGLKKDYSDVVAMKVNEDEKLQLIQDSYAKLGEYIVQTVKSPVQEKSEQANSVDNGQLTELANIVAGLAQKVDLLTTKLSEGQVLNGPKVPQPRQIQPQPFLPFSQTEQSTKPQSLKDIVARSVGL